jgi:hypothetical protein
MTRFFLFLFNYFRNKRILFFTIFIIAGFVAFFLASKITFEEDITKSLSGENEKISEILKQSKFTNQVILNIFSRDSLNSANPEQLVSFSDDLVDSLQNKNFSRFTTRTAYKMNDSLLEDVINSFYINLPIFLDGDDYRKIDSLLLPETIDKSLENNYKTLISPSGMVLKKFILQDPVGIASLALAKLKQFQVDDGYEIFDGYLFTKNRRNLLLFINPVNPASETSKNATFFRKLDKLLNSLTTRYNNSIKAEY